MSDVDLKFIGIAMPPLRGDSEATHVKGIWQPTASRKSCQESGAQSDLSSSLDTPADVKPPMLANSPEFALDGDRDGYIRPPCG
jgi:hypothetical protein